MSTSKRFLAGLQAAGGMVLFVGLFGGTLIPCGCASVASTPPAQVKLRVPAITPPRGTAPIATLPPVVFWSSSPVKPGQIAIVQGSDLARCRSVRVQAPAWPTVAAAQAAQDAVVQTLSGNIIPTETAFTIRPLQGSADSLAFRLPRRLAIGPVQVQLKTAGGTANFWLNRPTIWWVQGNDGLEASPGGWIEVFGNCLTGTVRIDGKPTASTGGSAFARRISLPRDMHPGRYTVAVGDGKELAFQVVTPAAATKVQETVHATGGDDTGLIQSALNRAGAAGGGTVYLPSQRYRLKTMLVVPPHVVMRGGGENRTLLSWAGGPNDHAKPPAALIQGTGWFTIEDLTIHCGNCRNGIVSSHDPPWATADVHAAGHITISHVRMRMDPFIGEQHEAQIVKREGEQAAMQRDGAAIYVGGPDVRVVHCNIYAAHMGLIMVNCRGLIVRDNRVYLGFRGWEYFEGCRRAIIAHNTIRGGTALCSGGIGLSCFSHGCSEDVYCADNDIRRLYGWDREGIVVDAGGGEYSGAIAEAQGNVITLATVPTVPPKWGPTLGRGSALDIVNGRGMGQYRTVRAISGRRVTLARPFAVQPDKTSVVSLTILQRNYLFIGNHIKSCGSGVELFAGVINCIAFHNTAVRTANPHYSGGFWNLGSPYGGPMEPSWYIQWLGNRARGPGTQLGVYGGSWEGVPEPATLGCVVRGNKLSGGGMQIGGFYLPNVSLHPNYPYTQNVVVEDNIIRHAKMGLLHAPGAVQVIYSGNVLQDCGPRRSAAGKP